MLMGYPDRVTVCVSSQSGCAMDCTFCATGQMGRKNNLTAGEICAQAVLARREAVRLPASTPQRLSNVVFMGMGEAIDGCYYLATGSETIGAFGCSTCRTLFPQRPRAGACEAALTDEIAVDRAGDAHGSRDRALEESTSRLLLAPRTCSRDRSP